MPPEVLQPGLSGPGKEWVPLAFPSRHSLVPTRQLAGTDHAKGRQAAPGYQGLCFALSQGFLARTPLLGSFSFQGCILSLSWSLTVQCVTCLPACWTGPSRHSPGRASSHQRLP